jgi:hypothetical protein
MGFLESSLISAIIGFVTGFFVRFVLDILGVFVKPISEYFQQTEDAQMDSSRVEALVGSMQDCMETVSGGPSGTKPLDGVNTEEHLIDSIRAQRYTESVGIMQEALDSMNSNGLDNLSFDDAVRVMQERVDFIKKESKRSEVDDDVSLYAAYHARFYREAANKMQAVLDEHCPKQSGVKK